MCERRFSELESKQVVLLKHHPMNVKFTNPWYKGQVEDNLEDYVVVDVTSRVTRDKAFMHMHPTFAKDVSPFFVGPIVSPDGITAHIFEHYWQASKVFPCHLDDKGNIKDEYWKWREDWFKKPKVTDKTASRRPHSLLGYNDSDCLFSVYFNNGTWERLSYVEARKKIYISDYAKYVVKTDAFKWLKSLYEQGKKIAIVDFDGYNYYYDHAKEKLYQSYISKCKKNGVNPTVSLEDFTGLKTMNDVINCGFTPAGHGFIIKMLLENDLEVKDGQIIDHIGVLKCGEGINPLPFVNKEGIYEQICC